MVLPFFILAMVWGDPSTGLPRTMRDPPTVSVSIEHTDPYSVGNRVRVAVRVRAGSYLTVLRVDTRGRIHVLFPASPRGGGQMRSASEMSAPLGFQAGRPRGVGYVVAFASAQPFDYRSISRAGQWKLPPEWRQVTGDPLESLIRRVAVLAPSFRYDMVVYQVGGDFQFPRFACTGCHASTSGWDPYDGSCSFVRLEVVQSSANYMYRIAGPRSAVAMASRALPRLEFRGSSTTPRRNSSTAGRTLDSWRRGAPGAPAPAWIRESPRSTGKPALRRRSPVGPPRSSLPAVETPTRPKSYH
jgi:hypothetical protein